MNRIKDSLLLKAIAPIVIFTFIVSDISYAYPPEHNTKNYTMSLPLVSQMNNPMNETAARFQSMILSEWSVVYAISDIGDYYFGNKNTGLDPLPQNNIEEVIGMSTSNRLKNLGIEKLDIVPVEYFKENNLQDKLSEALEKIGFKGNLPKEGVVFALFTKGEERFLIQIAERDKVLSDDLPGYGWTLFDKYRVKYIVENRVTGSSGMSLACREDIYDRAILARILKYASEGDKVDIEKIAASGYKEIIRFIVERSDTGYIPSVGADLLKAMGDGVYKALFELLSDKDSFTRYKAARILDTLKWKSDNEVQLALYYFASEKWKELIGMGKHAVPILIKALNDDNPVVSIHALYAITNLQADPEIIPVLFGHISRFLSHENHMFRMAAVKMLEKLKWEPVTPDEILLFNIAGRNWTGQVKEGFSLRILRKALKDTDPEIRRYAARLFNDIIIKGDENIDCLKEALRDTDHKTRYLAAFALGRNGIFLPGSANILFQVLLEENDPFLRRTSVALINKMDGREKFLSGKLLKAFGDKDIRVRRGVLKIIMSMDDVSVEKDTDISELLNRALSDPDRSIRVMAVTIAGNMKSAPVEGIISILRYALSDDDSIVRDKAIEMISKLDLAEGGIIFLMELLSDNNVIRNDSINKILENKGESIIPYLEEALSSRMPVIRGTAARLLSSFKGWYWEPKDERGRIIYFFANSDWDELVKIGIPVVPYAIKFLDYDSVVKGSIINLLSALGPAALPGLLGVLGADDDYFDMSIREDLTNIFRNIGEEAYIGLVRQLRSGNDLISERAANILMAIDWEPSDLADKVIYYIMLNKWNRLEKFGVEALPYLKDEMKRFKGKISLRKNNVERVIRRLELIREKSSEPKFYGMVLFPLHIVLYENLFRIMDKISFLEPLIMGVFILVLRYFYLKYISRGDNILRDNPDKLAFNNDILSFKSSYGPALLSTEAAPRATELFDLIESALTSNREKLIKKWEEASGSGPINLSATSYEIADKLKTLKSIDNKELLQFEADGAMVSLIYLARRAKKENQKLIIAIEDGWIPGDLQKQAISPLKKEILNIKDVLRSIGLDNVEMISSSVDKIAEDAKNKASETNTKAHNIIVMARKITIDSILNNNALGMNNNKEEDKPFLASIDTEGLIEAYKKNKEDINNQLLIRLSRWLYITLEIASGKEAPALSWISYDKVNRRLNLLPAIELIDYKELKAAYKSELIALRSA